MVIRLITQTFVWFGAMGILLFIAAGTFAWLGAWAYLVLMGHAQLHLGYRLGPEGSGVASGAQRLTGARRAWGYDEYAAHVRYRLIPHVW